MARNHDAGWIEHDRQPGIDSSTGLPWNIVDMHPDDLNPIHRRSIERNAREDRCAGILSCMHTMGFYNGRMGQSDYAVMDDYNEKHPERIHPTVRECTQRIEGWKAELVNEGAALDALEARLWRSYRLLEAFDTMSIYFCLRSMEELEPHSFPNVPARGDECDLGHVRPRAERARRCQSVPLSGRSTYGLSSRTCHWWPAPRTCGLSVGRRSSGRRRLPPLVRVMPNGMWARPVDYRSSMTRQEFRATCGQFPTGVTVVTATSATGEHRGMTLSAFVSVSLYPYLVLISVSDRSRFRSCAQRDQSVCGKHTQRGSACRRFLLRW